MISAVDRACSRATLFRPATIATVLLTVLVAGCKVTVINPEGGQVVAVMPRMDICPERGRCDYDRNMDPREAIFEAVPFPGYEFKGWSRQKGLCKGKLEPCTLPELNDALKSADFDAELIPVFEKLPNAAYIRYSQGDEFRADDDPARGAEFARMAPLGNGGFVVVWKSISFESYDDRVYARIFARNGAPIGPSIAAVDERNGGFVTRNYATVIGLESGGFAVFWVEHNESNDTHSLRGKLFDSDGQAPGETFVIQSIRRKSIADPQLAGNAGQGFVLAWRESDIGLKAQRFDTQGAAVGEVLSIVDDFYAATPTFTSLNGGGYGMVWQGSLEGEIPVETIRQCFDTNMVALGQPVPFGAEGVKTAAPELAPLSGGGFVAAWVSSEPRLSNPSRSSIDSVRTQRFDADCALDGEALLATPLNRGRPGQAKVTGLSDGGFMVTWLDSLSTAVHYRQQFDSEGKWVFRQIRVSGDLRTRQSTGDLITLADGSYVVAWSAFQEDTRLSALQARVYGNP